MQHPETRSPATVDGDEASARWTDPENRISAKFTTSPNVIQLPTVVVAIEADAAAHGWHVRARHYGRLTYHQKSFGLLSVARREADQLAASRGWRLAS